MEPASLIDWIIRVSVFGLVLSLWSAGALVYARRRGRRNRQVAQRLGLIDGVSDAERVLHLWHEGEEATTIVTDRAPGRGWVGRLDQIRRDAGLETAARLVLLVPVAVVGVVGAVAFVLIGTWIPSLIAMAGAAAVCWSYLNFRIQRQSALFDRQLIDALELASRSLRAGHPVLAAFRVAADETPPPVGRLFAEICQQQELGASQEDALRSAAAKCRSTDMTLLAASVIIQLRSGGNLADMMERLALVIRDRIRLSRRVRVLTAQTQLSKRMLLGLPFAVFFVLHVISAEYMEPLYVTAAGQMLLGAAAGGMLLGWWAMNRISVLRY